MYRASLFRNRSIKLTPIFPIPDFPRHLSLFRFRLPVQSFPIQHFPIQIVHIQKHINFVVMFLDLISDKFSSKLSGTIHSSSQSMFTTLALRESNISKVQR